MIKALRDSLGKFKDTLFLSRIKSVGSQECIQFFHSISAIHFLLLQGSQGTLGRAASNAALKPLRIQ